MTTKDCNNCINGSVVSKERLRETGHKNITLCRVHNTLLYSNVVVIHRFCGNRRYVKTNEYCCFESGGFD